MPYIHLYPLNFSPWTADYIHTLEKKRAVQVKDLPRQPHLKLLSLSFVSPLHLFPFLHCKATVTLCMYSLCVRVPKAPEVLSAGSLLSLDKLHWPWLCRPLRQCKDPLYVPPHWNKGQISFSPSSHYLFDMQNIDRRQMKTYKNKPKRIQKRTSPSIISVWYFDVELCRLYFNPSRSLSIYSTALSTHSGSEWSTVSEMKRTKRDPLLWPLSSSLGRMRDCVGVTELVHHPSAGRSRGPDLTLLCLDSLPADLAHMIEAVGNGNSQDNLTWHACRIH